MNHNDSPVLPELGFTSGPVDPAWQFNFPVDIKSYTAMLSWRTSEKAIDGQVPGEVRRLVSEAVCSVTRQTFLSANDSQSKSWAACDGGYCCMLRGLRPVWLTGRPDYPLFSTVEPDQASLMFEADPFTWQLQQQVVLLSDIAVLPELTYSGVDQAYRHGRFSDLYRCGVTGLLTPGVDGDFIGLASFQPDGIDALVQALKQRCIQSGFRWKSLSEKDVRYR